MRISQLATQRNVNGKQLVAALKAAGFEVKSDLAKATDEIIAWVEKQPDEALVPPKKQTVRKTAKKATKKTATKKTATNKKKTTSKKTTTTTTKKKKTAAKKTATTKKPAAAADSKPAAQKSTGKEEGAGKDKAAATGKKAEKASGKADKAKKKPEKTKTAVAPATADAAQPGLQVADTPATEEPSGDSGPAVTLLLEDEEQTTRHTGFKHKRADFKSRVQAHALPAGFVDIDSAYTRSLATNRLPRRPSRSRRSHRPRRGRSRRRGAPISIERDPNAIYTVSLGMTVRDISVALGIKLADIMTFLMKSGAIHQVNDILSEEEIQLIADEFAAKIQWKSIQDLEADLEQQFAARKDDGGSAAVSRPPIMTFLGHVDHGKTSLLDKIRQARVAADESGGITQHIGAYCIEKNGQPITFLDTPGHEAFTAMRARGASLTDIAVLVVAADDGVMPQTEEACSHARNAGVPIVVAINKCDLPNANPERVRQELATRLELLPEEWGGQVGMVNVSAATGEGIEDLLERILLEAEMLELTADPSAPATGHVVEAQVSKSQGTIVTLLVGNGTLHRGDIVLCGDGFGKIKLMYNEYGQPVEQALPGHPVRVVGLSAVPDAGDSFYVLDDLARARAIAEQRQHATRTASLARRAHVTLENLQAHLAQNQTRELNIIIKADVMGSLEVLQKTLQDISTEEVRIRVIHAAVGGINQADIILADASDAIVVGFHVVADQTARLLATSHSVQIKIYHVIYHLLEDMRAALEGMLPPERREVVQGHLEIRQVFRASRLGNIAGCHVSDGVVTRSSRVRLIRDNVIIYDGEIASLKRVKDDAREVRSGFECGLKIAGYNDIKVGDTIEAYAVEEVRRTLD